MTCSLTRPKKLVPELTTNRFTLNQISHQNIRRQFLPKNVDAKRTHTSVRVKLLTNYCRTGHSVNTDFPNASNCGERGKNNWELHDVGNVSPAEQANAKCGTENVYMFWRFGVFGWGRTVFRDGEEEEEEEEDGAGVGVGRSAHTAQGGRSACQVQVHAGTRQDPTHSQPW